MRNLKIKEINEIKVHGRTTSCREPLTLFWTASGFECNVSGSEFWIDIEVDYDIYEPWFSYTINGDWVGRQMLQKGRYELPLFRGMSIEQIKNVHFYKDLQAMSGDGRSYIHIHGVRLDGEFYPVAEKKCKLEFIGDSITSGEGLFGAKQEQDWIPMFFSALKDYAYLTAKDLDADYRVFSQSGWGVHHSWDNNLNCALPKYYREICSLMPGEINESLGGNQPNDFEAWQPDTVIVNLGTNDASGFDQPEWSDKITGQTYKPYRNQDGTFNRKNIEEIQGAIIDFLKLLRDCNPQADIVWCYGMLGTDLLLNICEAIADYQKTTGDQKVSFLQLPNTDNTNVGSRMHPGFECHRKAAEVLVNYLRREQHN